MYNTNVTIKQNTDMANTMEKITMQYADLQIAVKDKMREVINTKGKKIDGEYKGMNYILTESQRKKLAIFSDREVVSVGITDKFSGGIYVEGKNRRYTAFDCIPFQIRFNILGCLTNQIK